MDVTAYYAAVTKIENVKFSSKIFELLFDRLVIWNVNELEVKLIIMSIAVLKLRYGKLTVIGLMFMTKYSCCHNRLMLFCSHAHSNWQNNKFFMFLNCKGLI